MTRTHAAQLRGSQGAPFKSISGWFLILSHTKLGGFVWFSYLLVGGQAFQLLSLYFCPFSTPSPVTLLLQSYFAILCHFFSLSLQPRFRSLFFLAHISPPTTTSTSL